MKHSSRPRATAELPKTLHEQLNMYALAAGAAGVGLLALAQPAQAEIVYTPAHKKLHLNHYFFLDLNHDGVNDFKFFMQAGVTYSNNGCTAEMFAYRVNRGNGAAAKTSNQYFFASALKAGVRIGKSQYFPNQSREAMALENEYFAEGTFEGPWASSGRPVDHRYLGLRFIFGGQVHYGWARFNVWIHALSRVDCTVSATLTGYAYETIPNKAIVAGKTKGPDDSEKQPSPEAVAPSGALGRLALGRK
jgi:hypothetical protein